MVVFQLLLLAGYLYADVGVQRIGVQRMMWLHAAVLLLSFVFLPRHDQVVRAGVQAPVVAVAVMLVLIGGTPFFVLSTNSSLTQRWFVMARYRSSADPFWLYAASNVGSLGALLAYPLIVEPLFGVRKQLQLWATGYIAFVVLSIVTMLVAARRARADHRSDIDAVAPADVGEPASAITPARRLGWTVRAAIASSLLLSVTTQITTDVIAAPLLWVLPLALYLLTFVIAFSATHRVARGVIAYACMIGIALCLVVLVIPTMLPLWFAFSALLATLFAGALLCHTDVAADRPDAQSLTNFYLWLSVGGAVGGLLNSIITPLVTTTVAEFPLTLLALALCVGSPSVIREWSWPKRWRSLAGPVHFGMLAAIVIAAVFVALGRTNGLATSSDTTLLQWQFMPLAVLACGILFSRQAGVFPVSIALVTVFVVSGLHYTDRVVHQGRSFFGVSRVTENATERVLVHGVTIHGAQRKAPALRNIPTSYYSPRGPLGWAVAQAPPGAVIGVVGLGAGSLAALAQPGQTLTFFEIDPLVVEMATRDFTYLANSRARVSVEIGDGRQLIASRPDNQFDVLILDAFSGDAVPTHLLTTEALSLCLNKLKTDGLLVVHISNRFADLTRVFRGWRDVSGMRVAVNEFTPTPDEQREGVRATVAVALGRSPRGLMPLAQTGQWRWLGNEGATVTWTDDHASLLGVLSRNVLQP